MDKTAEVIQIPVIESIIRNENAYLDFLNHLGNFTDIDDLEYVGAINDYMRYAINKDNNLRSEDFERVNYINLIYGKDIQYDFEEYLNHTEQMITFSALLNILNNEEILNKFLKFNDNKDYFENISLDAYLMELEQLRAYCYNNKISLTDQENRSLHIIEERYAIELKRIKGESWYEVQESPDKRLMEEVVKGVDMNQDPLTIAYWLYVRLCNLLTYDVSYAVLQEVSPEAKESDIYNKSIKEIGIENNQVICKSWAELYCSILSNMGVKAIVAGNGHKYVLFEVNGEVIKADATNVYRNQDENFYMCDLARVQAGLKTTGFIYNDSTKKINSKIDEMNSIIDNHVKTLEEHVKSLEERYITVRRPEGIENEFKDSINMLASLASDSKLKDFELFKYVKALSKVLFPDEVKNKITVTYVALTNSENEFHAGMLMTLEDCGEYHYVIIDKYVANEISLGEVKDMIENNSMYLIGNNIRIPGLTKENENGLTK